MWPPHLRRPSAGMSEQTRRKKVAAGRKILQEYQQRNHPDRPAASKNKKNTREGGNPKTNTAGDCAVLKGVAQDHAHPEPPPPMGTVTAATGKGVTGSSNIEDLERRCQHLVLALDSSRTQIQQLRSDIQQMKHEKEDLQDQQREENQKMACVQEALRVELEQHKLCIQVLSSEKWDLQSALAHMQQVASERALEQESLTRRLQAAEQRVAELEMTSSADSTKQTEAEQNNIELLKALNRVKLQLQAKARCCEDLEDENTELQERLEELLTQKAAMKIQMQEGQQALEERAGLESQVNHMREVVRALQLERDSFAEDLRVERCTGQEKVQQLAEQVSQLREEKEQGLGQVGELESRLVELRKQLSELQPPQPPAGPCEAEQQLQAQALQWQQELKNVQEQLHMQVEENQSLGLQLLEQQQRLWILQKRAEEWDQNAEDRRKILETMEKEHETMRCTLVLNRQLKEQLGQLQDALQRLSAEKEELASQLLSEQQEKTTLQEKLAELENLEGKKTTEFKSQATEHLQELHDQYVAQLQELRATSEEPVSCSQQLSSEKEALQQHLLRQTHLLKRLQQEQVQRKLLAQMEREKFQGTLQCLEATRHENAQLRAQLSSLAFPREGGGLGTEEKDEEATASEGSVPEDVDNPQSMCDFYEEALSIAECKKARLSRQLQEQQARCGCLSQLAAQWQRKLEGQAPFAKRWIHGLFEKRKQEAQAPKKLKICFHEDLAAQVDGQSAVDDLQHRCSQLAQHVSALEETIVSYKEQMDVLEKLWEGTECQDVMLAATQAPAAQAPSHLAGPLKMEVRKDQQELEGVCLEENLEPGPGEARALGPLESPTSEPPVLLLPAVKPHQDPASLSRESCLPFFYKAEAKDVFDIITI
ncbi:golgin subfamily A member 2-like [Thomomys bottae]